jgi:hypothetical protein
MGGAVRARAAELKAVSCGAGAMELWRLWGAIAKAMGYGAIELWGCGGPWSPSGLWGYGSCRMNMSYGAVEL